jgi:hypothetical protein
MLCAGGSAETGFFKNYGDPIEKGEENIKHDCFGWGESFDAFVARRQKK